MRFYLKILIVLAALPLLLGIPVPEDPGLLAK